MTDVLDHIWDFWCRLCQAAHPPCETSDEWGHDIGTPDPVENPDGE